MSSTALDSPAGWRPGLSRTHGGRMLAWGSAHWASSCDSLAGEQSTSFYRMAERWLTPCGSCPLWSPGIRVSTWCTMGKYWSRNRGSVNWASQLGLPCSFWVAWLAAAGYDRRSGRMTVSAGLILLGSARQQTGATPQAMADSASLLPRFSPTIGIHSATKDCPHPGGPVTP